MSLTQLRCQFKCPSGFLDAGSCDDHGLYACRPAAVHHQSKVVYDTVSSQASEEETVDGANPRASAFRGTSP